MPIAAIKGLPSHARDIFESTMKATEGKYSDERRGKIAWAAVKKAYKKTKDGWVAKKNALNISKNMKLSDVCSPRLLATHMLLHDWSTSGRDGWKGFEIKSLHDRVIKELLKRNIDHKKKKECELDQEKPEGIEPEEDEDADIEEYELSDYDLKVFNEMAEILKIPEELKKEPAIPTVEVKEGLAATSSQTACIPPIETALQPKPEEKKS